MKLLFDQNISQRIVKLLPLDLSDSQHVKFVGLEDSKDIDIFNYAKNHNLAIVTFDSDFVDLNAMFGVPPKIIYLNTGNLTTKNISEILESSILKIQHYLNSKSDDILEIIKN